MGRRRLERVTELIHQEVSKLILQLKDPGLGFVTVLAVRMTPDFASAKIFYSVLGPPDERRRTEEALERARPYIRSQLRSLESLKTPPDLTFVLDNSAEEAAKVLSLLSQLEQERKKNAISKPPEKNA
jgi:ribosome-binding factor A